MEFCQWIGLVCLVVAGTIFIILGVTFKSVWIKPKVVSVKPFEKIDKRDAKATPQLYCQKETKYNNFWKKVWEK